MIERLGPRATALFAVAALCASLAFAFAAASSGGTADADAELSTGEAAGVDDDPTTTTTTPISTTTPPTTAPTTTVAPEPTTTAPPTTAAPSTTAAVDVTASAPPPLAPATPPADGIPAPNPTRVFVFGDSVILGAKAVLPQHLPGWDVVVDAAESRFEHEAPDLLRARRADIGRVAVILIGHNSGPGYNHETWIRKMMDELAGVERVVFLTAVEWGPGPAEFNATLRRIAPEYPVIAVADWNALSAANPSYTFDGLHLLGPGQTAMAELIARFVGPPPA